MKIEVSRICGLPCPASTVPLEGQGCGCLRSSLVKHLCKGIRRTLSLIPNGESILVGMHSIREEVE